MKSISVFLLFLFVQTYSITAQYITSELWTSGINNVVDMEWADNGKVFVLSKWGLIYETTPAGTDNAIVLDIEGRVNTNGGERGLLGMALHPEFAANGYVYVHYTGSGGRSIISRFAWSGDAFDSDSEKIIMEVDQPFSNHNAGELAFGPDGFLYIGFGDGGSANDPGNRSQNPLLLLGKMLRIDIDTDLAYVIPEDNPFVNSADTLSEIWSTGWRNPWKFSFDMTTNDMYIADVGQNKWEEISYEPFGSKSGQNYGWRCFEGFEEFNPSGCGDPEKYTDPIHVYENNAVTTGCSVTGGFVYRGANSFLYGKYIYGDYCSGKIWALYQSACGEWNNDEILDVADFQLSTFGQDRDGELYYGMFSSGDIFKMIPVCDIDVSIEKVDPTCEGMDGRIIVSNLAATGFSVTGPTDGLGAGTYDITITSDDGCQEVFCVELETMTTVQFPDVNVNNLDAYTCEGTSYFGDFINLLSADYTMSLLYDGTVIDPSWNGELLASEAGLYELFFTAGDCSSSPVEILNLSVVPTDTVLLEFSEDGLQTVKEYFEYQWYENNILMEGQTDRVLANEFVMPGVEYYVIVTNDFGCAYQSEVKVILNTDETPLLDLELSPNPANDHISFSVNAELTQDLTVNVFNMAGQRVQEFVLKNNYDLEISEWQEGEYFYTIRTSNKNIVSSGSFVKLK